MLQYNIVEKRTKKKGLRVEKSSRVTKVFQFFFLTFSTHVPLPFFSCRKGTEQGMMALKLLNAVLCLAPGA